MMGNVYTLPAQKMPHQMGSIDTPQTLGAGIVVVLQPKGLF